ncbi:MAG: hypothetical protein ACJ790_05725 [Myxococcaceae bacterium]
MNHCFQTAARSVLLAAAMMALACQSEGEKKPAENAAPPGVTAQDLQGWPSQLYYARLQMPEKEMRRLSTEGSAPGVNLEAPDVVKKHYAQIGPTAHGAEDGTDVYWVKSTNTFFIRSDCGGYHNEGFIGPFDGDPRVVLKPVTEPAPAAKQ